MKLSKVHQLEQAVVTLLNLDGWNLEHCGNGFEHFDCIGTTPKGVQCIIEMKFRKKYYEEKMIEKYKYDKLLEEDALALYFVNDPKGNYMYWLNNLEMPKIDDKDCPKTTMWDNTKVSKEVYLLKESDASIINRYEEEEPRVWDEYFRNKKK